MLKHLAAWVTVALLVAGVAGGLGLYKYNELEAAKAAAAASPEPVEAVTAVAARQGEWSVTTRAIGTVVAQRYLEIRNELAGTVAKVGFASGDIVEAGQTLVEFDVRQERALLAAAEAEARLAKATLDRREGLRNSAAFSGQDYDRAREEFAAASARARNLEVAIDKKKITAPFRARIGITDLQPGAYLDVGGRIATLQGVSEDAYVDFALPQDQAAAVRSGGTVSLSAPVIPGGATAAKVVAEDDSVDRANRTVRFRAAANGLGEALRPGMFVDVLAVTSPPKPAILVPLASVRRSPHGEHVFVLVAEEGKLRARQRAVEAGAVREDEVAISQGLAAGELVAASGSFKLRDGLAVTTDAPTTASAGVRLN